MSASRFFKAIRAQLLAAACLGIGCAPDFDAAEVSQDDPQPEERLSTHPLEPLSEVAEAPKEQDVAPLAQEQVQPSGASDECGAIPATLTRETAARRTGSSGYTEYTTKLTNLLTRLHTKMTVPAKPPPSGTIFLWPGVQPIRGPNFSPISNGVLQPVLTWGSSCAPGSPYGYNSWWISGLYVNVSTTLSTHRNCHGGPVMKVNTGDVLDVDIALNGSVWKQTIKNLTSGQMVDYAIDMKGQEQGRAIFDIELPTRAKPVADMLFTETVLTFAAPLTRACTPATQGETDYVSKARLSADGTKCCIDRIALRAKGVTATTTP